MNQAIHLTNLVVHRDGRQVLTIDSLDIQPGDVIAIIGPNGAGKSSFLLALSRLLKTKSGSVVFGENSDTQPLSDLDHRRKLALVMQEPLLIDASVFDNIALGLRYRGVGLAEIAGRVERWAGKFNIQPLMDRSANKISGGEAQRVSLARAFVLEPDLLLLDEPFSSLDPQTRKNIIQDLKKILNDTHTTTLFVTHDLDDSMLLADRIAVIWDGALIQFGSKEDVLRQPVTNSLKTYLGAYYTGAR